jgi:hypothetical protein
LVGSLAQLDTTFTWVSLACLLRDENFCSANRMPDDGADIG